MDDSRSTSWMAREIASIPEIVEGQENVSAHALDPLVRRLEQNPPQLVVTCARGSSAHAATFGKHLIERYIGIPVAAAAPSIASVYGQRLALEGQLVLAISQSGASDDLIAFAAEARAAGAITVAITNEPNAPLAAACEIAVPMAAGAEHSVPATKTFVATLAVLLRLTAAWTGDAPVKAAVTRLPQRLSEAAALDWGAAVDAFADASGLATIGRGPTLAVAREAALKLKETCNINAEAFSGAEFLHGPVALVSPRYPVLMFMPGDAAASGLRELAAKLGKEDTQVLSAQPGPGALGRLPVLAPDQPEADAICLIQNFYSMLVELCARRGVDPDRPRHLSKVTRTT
jgi:glucosamine--fructose-6-phosphate aminotransferase (isomerizing)